MGLGSAFAWLNTNVWRRVLSDAARTYGGLSVGPDLGNYHWSIHNSKYRAVRSEAVQRRRVLT